MILLRHDGPARSQTIAIFGLGLIGQAILYALKQREDFRAEHLPFDWRDPVLRQEHLKAIGNALARTGAQTDRSHIDVVWSGGKAGFGATDDELFHEDEPLRDVLAFAEGVVEQFPGARYAFHLLSSAGGLFEGQRFVGRQTRPAPVRPYGRAKLRQEDMAHALRSEICTSIYRPSSVYGLSQGTGRTNLIGVLVTNGLAGRVSHLFGDGGTLRDYVHAFDIGAYVAAELTAAAPRGGTFLLASGKPSSVHEIVRLVERAIGRRLLVRIDPRPSNAAHISFCADAIAVGFSACDLDTGVRKTARDLLYAPSAHIAGGA